MTPNDIESALRFCDSYSRLPTLMSLSQPRSADSSAWFLALGQEWSCCDNIWRFRAELSQILEQASPEHKALMMTQEERDTLSSLPDVITIYRGCYPWNDAGLSWSLSRDVAASFPRLRRYRHPEHEAFVYEARANKRDCILKLDRDEQEIICWSHEFQNRYSLEVDS